MPADIVVATAGAVSAGFSTFSVYPLDTIKTHLNKGVTEDGKPLKTVRDVVDMLIHKKGVLSLYSGVQLKVVMAMLQKFFYFYIYNFLYRKASFSSGSRRPVSLFMNLCVGYASALVSVALLTPLEVAQTRQQLDSGTKPLREVLFEILKSHQTYTGFGTNLFLCINPSIELTVFDQIKKRKGVLTEQQTFWVGAFAKAVATVATFPHVRAKVLQQSGLEKFKDMDATSIIARLVVTEGPLSLFQGMQMQLAKNVLSAAIMHSVKASLEQRVMIWLDGKKKRVFY